MRKHLLALSIAAMVGGLSGAAYAQAKSTTNGGLDLISFSSSYPDLNDTAPTSAIVQIKKNVGFIPGTAANTNADGKNLGLTIPPAAGQLTPTTTGIGHILFVPYFTTQGSNHSLLNIVNTDQVNGKAVKLRYRGAANSDDLFDITIYLSPGDVWTADVAVDSEGYSRLVTSDTSCTLPSIAEIKSADNNNGRFKTHRVNGGDKAQTREGYIEILNTADIPPLSPVFNTSGAVTGTTTNQLYVATKHVNGVAPCSQAVMAQQLAPLTTFDTDPSNTPGKRGYSWPTGGLLANWSIVDVTKTASFSGEAVALRATPANIIDVAGAGNIVWAPQTSDIVSTVNVDNLTADPLLRRGSILADGSVLPAPTIKAASYDFPDLSTPYTSGFTTPAAQAADLARQLATRFVTNEYLTNTSVSFATDWVFSMPTRRYATAVDYANLRAVFNPLVNGHFTANNITLDRAKAQLCADVGNQRGYDREENFKVSFVISPDIMQFCGEVSVFTFNASNKVAPVLGSAIANKVIETSFADGWFTINTPGLGNGLPVIGYAAAKATGNIGGTWVHRTQP